MQVHPFNFSRLSQYQNKKASAGFTIIEVMIVLSISAAMLVSAAAVFGSRRQATEFSQAMYDAQSEFQSIANAVSSKSVPGVEDQFRCQASKVYIGGKIRPVLFHPASPKTFYTNNACIYLGQLIQVTKKSAAIYSYPVFGLTDVYSGTTDTGTLPTTFDEANPEVALSRDNTGPSGMLLIDTYNLINGLSVSWARFNGLENDFLTLYSSLESDNTSGNEISVASYVIASNGSKSQLKSCIEAVDPPNICPAVPPNLSIFTSPWKICLTNGTQLAELTLIGTSTGVTTSLNMNGCPP